MQVTSFMQVWQTILQAIPDTARPVLETFVPTGMADLTNIMQFTNLTRDRVNRAVERLASAASRPIFICSLRRVPRFCNRLDTNTLASVD
jgi:hypothetical protein